jgi:hypothetical protein
VHIDLDERENFFNDLKEAFKAHKMPEYQKVFDYFESFWLKTYFIKFNSEDKEEVRFRTNNICESFNAKLNRFMDITHPSLGVFIEKILILELKYRQSFLELVDAGQRKIQRMQLEEEESLPFNKLQYFLEKNKIQLSKYDLRSNDKKNQIHLEFSLLLQKCHDSLYQASNVPAELEKSNNEIELDNLGIIHI